MLYLDSYVKIDNLYIDYIYSKANILINNDTISIIDNMWKKQFNLPLNTYISLSAYFWPDTTKQDGTPYVRKSIINFDKYKYSDRKYIDDIIFNIKYLTLAYLLSQKEVYAIKSIEFINKFFIDNQTGMTPSLDYSGIKILSNSKFAKSGCIVDTNSFWVLGDLIEIISNSSQWDSQKSSDMMLWFKRFGDWFLHSKYGVKSKDKINNWLTSYYVQLLSYLHYSQQKEFCKQIFENNFEKILTTQIDAYGNQLNEQCRDYPIHYSNYNLHLLTRLALIGKKYDINIWSYQDFLGKGSIYRAMTNTAKYIQQNNQVSELKPNYNLTWAKIAYKIYGNNIFKDIYLKYDKKLEYCLDEFLRLEQNF